MRIAFGTTVSYKPASSIHSPKAETLPSPSGGTDFRDSLPPLAFAGIISRKTPSETPELDAAQGKLLKQKVSILSNSLAAKLRRTHFTVPAPDHACHIHSVIPTLSLSLAQISLRKFPPKVKGTKENATLAAQYACLLLLNNPDMFDFVLGGLKGTSLLRDGHFTLKNGTDENGMEYRAFFAYAGVATKRVQEWLNDDGNPRRILRIKELEDSLAALQSGEEQLRETQNPGDKMVENWMATQEEIEEKKQRLEQLKAALGEPELPENPFTVDLDALNNDVEASRAGLDALKRLDEN